MDDIFNNSIVILDEVIDILTKYNQDISWSQYQSLDELLNFLDTLKIRLNDKKKSAIRDLYYLFGPTASFQEISISSGWSDEYMKLASSMDKIFNCIK